MKYNIDEIKDKIPLMDYARSIGYEINTPGQRCRAQYRAGSNNTSLLIGERTFKDFGSGVSGDIIDFAALNNHGGDKGAAIRELAQLAGVFADEKEYSHIEIRYKVQDALLQDVADYYMSAIPKKLMKYFDGRNITPETIAQLKIGYADNPCEHLQGKNYTMEDINDSGILSFLHRIIIPYIKCNKVVS